MWMRKMSSWMFPFLAVNLLGCAVETEDAEPSAVGETAQAVTVTAEYEWGSTTTATVDLGSAADQTCFLTSVRGDMVTWWTDMGNPDIPAEAGVEIVNGHWQFREWSNGPMAAAVRCVSNVTNRTAVGTWKSGAVATVLGPVTANRQCFLTKVAKTNSAGWSADSDNVHVWKDKSSWYIGGTPLSGASGDAVCVDFPGNDGSWLWVAGGGSATHDLAYNPGGVQCFLTGLGGHFDALDYNDGVKIGYDAGVLTFNETVVNGKSGWATCVH